MFIRCPFQLPFLCSLTTFDTNFKYFSKRLLERKLNVYSASTISLELQAPASSEPIPWQHWNDISQRNKTEKRGRGRDFSGRRQNKSFRCGSVINSPEEKEPWNFSHLRDLLVRHFFSLFVCSLACFIPFSHSRLLGRDGSHKIGKCHSSIIYWRGKCVSEEKSHFYHRHHRRQPTLWRAEWQIWNFSRWLHKALLCQSLSSPEQTGRKQLHAPPQMLPPM